MKRTRLAAWLLLPALLVSLLPVRAAENEAVTISGAADLLALAEGCSLDAWSRGKTFILTADISLASVDFPPIPSFGGTFDGNGHTISGLDISEKLSPAGLFGVVQEGAVVKNLTLSAVVAPAGDGALAGGIAGRNDGLIANCTFSGEVSGEDRVGGIAGQNGLTGQIESCTVSGSVSGKSMTGGVTGANNGVVTGCRNESYVNIVTLDPGINLSELELSADLLSLRALDAANIATDTGGIAGFSDGLLLSCVNDGMVGYPHTGYNVGGVAGRSSGFLSACVNQGPVYGRKDIGGIAGQAEPHVVLDLSEDSLDAIRSQLHQLEQLVDKTAADAGEGSAGLTEAFAALNECLDKASGCAQDLSQRLGSYGGSLVSEVDRGGAVLSDAAGQLSEAVAKDDGLTASFTGALNSLETAVRQLQAAGVYTDEALERLESAGNELSRAAALLASGTASIKSGAGKLKEAWTAPETPEAPATPQEGQIAQGVGDLSRSAALTGSAMDALSPVLGGGAGEAASSLAGALEDLSETLALLQELLPSEATLEAMKAALADVEAGLGDVAGGLAAVSDAASALGEALQPAQSLSAELQTALGTLADAMAGLSAAASRGGAVLSGIREVVDYLAGVDPIQIAQPDEALGESSGLLFAALDRLGDCLDRLNAAAGSSAGLLTADLQAVNARFGTLMDTVLDAAYGLEESSDRISDTSEADVESVTSGKLLRCVNEGSVQGDLCTGGIAGAMGVEYELDPEDDIPGSDAPLYRRAYEMKVILQSCVNRACVTSRRSYAGGVCGRSSLGLLTACENYGTVESETGDYTGGIAGSAAGAVRGCSAKCSLRGKGYVGGIVGAAGGESGSGGEVTDCRAFVRIAECEQFGGAISGTDQGLFRGNFFTADGLAGLGRASVAGQAEPLSYEALLETEGVPGAFRTLTLRFLADGAVLKRVEFQYGDSFDASVYPALPAKEGCYARWDTETLAALRFDTDVEAVYSPFLTALSSDEIRSDGRPVLLAEGRFSGGDRLTLRPVEADAPLESTLFSRRRMVELWSVGIPEDGSDIRTLRYLSPNGSVDGLEVYTLWNGVWVRVEAEPVGTYLVFPAEGTAPVLAVVEETSLVWLWVAAAIALAVLLIALWRLVRALLRRLRKKAPPVKTPRRRWPWITAAAAVLLAGGGAVLYFTGALDSVPAARVLYDTWNDPAIPLELTAEASLGGEALSLDAELLRADVDGKTVFCIRQLGSNIYCCDGTLYLENGHSCALGGTEAPDYASVFRTLRLLFADADSSVYENGAEKIYSIAVRGDTAAQLLANLLPGAGELEPLEALNVDLTVRSNRLRSLRFTADGALSDGRGASFDAVLTARETPETPELPAAVREAVRSGEAEHETELLTLLSAWARRNARDPMSARLELSVDCGPLVRRDSLELQRTLCAGKTVRCIRRTGRSVYLCEQALYDEEGALLAADEAVTAQSSLPELAFRLCLQSAPERRQADGTDTYVFSLTEAEWAEALQAISPAAAALDVSCGGGSLEADVAEGELTELRLFCAGAVRLQSAQVPASLSATLRFIDDPFLLPSPVEAAVKRS